MLALWLSLSAFAHGVQINGETVTDDRLASLEQRIGLHVAKGKYWYDAASGLWGAWGAPPTGVTVPGLDLGVVPADASAGHTGAFLNGRELSDAEVDVLVRLYGVHPAGRYTLTADGRLAHEGAYAYANLFLDATRAVGELGEETFYAFRPAGVQKFTWSVD